ncbi:MAG: hypothetical protein JWQ40_5031 [Segetibacter sp.]|nr:hypothetical protein [Segetibacter sp.]
MRVPAVVLWSLLIVTAFFSAKAEAQPIVSNTFQSKKTTDARFRFQTFDNVNQVNKAGNVSEAANFLNIVELELRHSLQANVNWLQTFKNTPASNPTQLAAEVENGPFTMQNINISACGFTFLDPGGTGNYGNSGYTVTTISPADSGNKLRVVFSKFRTEASGDYLVIYDGPGTASPYLGSFSGTTLPPAIESSALNGELTFAFSTNSSGVESGWEAYISCFRPVAAPANLTSTTDSAKRVNLAWTDNENDETEYVVERSTGDAQHFQTLINLNRNASTYTDSSAPGNGFIYYRVRAFRDTTASKFSNTASVVLGDAPFIMENINVSVCGVTFLDPGGFGNYSNSSSVITTFTPSTSGHKIRVAFSSFRTELYTDYLYVYNGPNTHSPYLGYFSGSTLPQVLESTAPNGELTFAFSSNSSVTDSGWQAHISCFKAVTAPTNLTATVDSAKRVNLSWSDNANDETKYVVERSINDQGNFLLLKELAMNTTTFTDSTAPDNSNIYYRAAAARHTTISKYGTPVSVKIGNAPYNMQNGAFSTCSTTFLDGGGFGNYSNSTYFTTTISPAVSGNKLRVAFTSFRTELNGDILSIYDGPNSTYPLLGYFSGNMFPPVVESSASNGELTFVFYSDSAVVDSGWRANISCFKPVSAPTNLTALPDNNKKVNLRWSDNATDETKYVVERSINDTLHFTPFVTLPANTSVFTDSLATDNHIFYYCVNAWRDTIGSKSSNIVKVVIGNAINGSRWAGTVSSEWDDAENWSSSGVPATDANIVIEGGKNYYPKIRRNTTCGSLQVLQDATVEVATGYTLTILH